MESPVNKVAAWNKKFSGTYFFLLIWKRLQSSYFTETCEQLLLIRADPKIM